MNKMIIMQYVNKLKLDDIKRYCLNEGINITNDESKLIYDYIKHDTLRILNNPMEVILELEDKVSKEVYDKILELYRQYKNKIS